MNQLIFDGIGKLYDSVRPSYPDALFEYLQNEIGVDANSIIADIGSGTGILTEKLIKICKKVYAVEPNRSMRNVANNKLWKSTKYVSIDGTAENTGLCDNCLNYVTAAQSFHWFNRSLFRNECQRILKNNGFVILIWNCRDQGNELVQVIDKINEKYCSNFSGFKGGMRGAVGLDDYEDFFVNGYDTKIFRNDILLDKRRFIGLHNSASYRLEKSDINYKNYIYDLQRAFDKYSLNGNLFMPYLTKCYIGTV